MNSNQPVFLIPSELRDALRRARHVVVLTGAGISAESGVPTFRDVMTGLWAQYHPQDLATPQAFARNPQLVWEWYAWRRELVSKVEPNAGHRALAELERHVPHFTLITQMSMDCISGQAARTWSNSWQHHAHEMLRGEDDSRAMGRDGRGPPALSKLWRPAAP